MTNAATDQRRTAASHVDWHALIHEDRVHGSLYTDPAVWAAELEEIWYRTWIFVGHVSEVPAPNDYVLKSIGPQPVIMTRDRDGEVRLLLNRCSHRANQVCDFPAGNTTTFRCPYHGWTFSNTGALLGYPFSSGYGGRDRKADLGLAAVPARRRDPWVRVRLLRARRPIPRRAPRSGRRRVRPARATVADRRDRADVRLAAARGPRQLEDAARERDRRVPPPVRAQLDLRRRRQRHRRAVRRAVDGRRPRPRQRPHRGRPATRVPPHRSAARLVRHPTRAGAVRTSRRCTTPTETPPSRSSSTVRRT